MCVCVYTAQCTCTSLRMCTFHDGDFDGSDVGDGDVGVSDACVGDVYVGEC